MNEQRVRKEVVALRDQWTVRGPKDQILDLLRFTYPSDWTPQVSTLRYELPPDYPASPPSVHIPADMEYRGQRNIGRMLQSPHAGYAKWCIHMDGWQPRRHTLVTVTREMMGSLSDPSRRRLFTESG